MNSNRPLAGRVALVTGAGPGLGRALARSLAEAGANLVVCDINEASLAAARAAVEETDAECLTVRCDVSDSAAVQRMFAQAAERFGTVHILVNNAALTPNRKDDDVRRNRQTPEYSFGGRWPECRCTGVRGQLLSRNSGA